MIFDGEVVFRGQGGRYLFREALAFLVLINEPDREDLIKRFRSPYVEDEQTLLIDEPENHLHPNAMVDIRNWLTETISDSSISAILATHSPTFLDYSHEEASIVLVEKPPAQTAIAEDITNDVVYWLGEYGGSLGGETIDRLMLMRGFLLVEGPHDEEVINHFYEDELKRRRLGVLPMWGFKGLKLLDTRYLCYSDRPIVMLFDNIPVDHSREQQSMEERELKRIKGELREATFPFWSTGHKELDIIFTLPEVVVKRYLESKGINDTFEGGWKQIQQEIRSDSSLKTGTKKKTKAGQLLGLPNPKDLIYFPNFIAPVLQMCSENDRPTATLERTMEEIFAFFENPHSNR